MRAAFRVGVVAVAVAAAGAAAGQPGQPKEASGGAGSPAKPDVKAKLEGHRGGVSALAVSPKGDWVVTGSGNGVVRVWDAKTGELLGRVDDQKHNGAKINHVALSADGRLISSSSKNTVTVWGVAEDPKLDPKLDPKADPKSPPNAEAKGGRRLVFIADDPDGPEPNKIGTVTGDGRRFYFTTPEGTRVGVGSQPLLGRSGPATSDEFRGAFAPWAMAAIPDPDSGLVALYGASRVGDKTEPAIAFVGLGDARVAGRGVVRGQLANSPVSLSFAPDRRWLVASNGSEVMYWRVPGSQVISGDPKVLSNPAGYVAAAGPNGLIAVASRPEDGKKVTVTVVDVNSAEPRVVAVFATDIDRVSAMAFSPSGGMLAVADDVEGVVQLWSLEKK
jgi:WD40 repeat protein